VLRRAPFSLPYQDQVPALAALLQPGAPRAVDRPGSRQLVEAALYHNVAGYLARAVERGELSLSSDLRARVARTGGIYIVNSAALRCELAALEPALTQACGIPPVCLKGPAVADRFYPDPRLRPFADLDLLVPRESIGHAARLLSARGYEQLHEFRRGFGQRHGHDVHVVRRIGDRTLHVELHWRVGDDPLTAALDHRRLYGSARLELNGSAVSVPAVPEQIVCLAVHLLSDRAKRLIWINDLALIGRSACAGEWRQAFELARALGLGWPLHRAMDYAAYHLGFERERPLASDPPPPWGPLRAVEELDMRASTHIGRLVALRWEERIRYLRQVLIPSPEGLSGTVGHDGAPAWRLAGRHLRAVLLGLAPPRR
jgi:Uncharacterised nucleotidyltransferase